MRSTSHQKFSVFSDEASEEEGSSAAEGGNSRAEAATPRLGAVHDSRTEVHPFTLIFLTRIYLKTVNIGGKKEKKIQKDSMHVLVAGGTSRMKDSPSRSCYVTVNANKRQKKKKADTKLDYDRILSAFAKVFAINH